MGDRYYIEARATFPEDGRSRAMRVMDGDTPIGSVSVSDGCGLYWAGIEIEPQQLWIDAPGARATKLVSKRLVEHG